MLNNDFEKLYFNFFAGQDKDVIARKYHIGNYLYNFDDIYSVIKNKIALEKQKKLNMVFREISHHILMAAIENNIRIAFVKGIFLANYIDSDCLKNRASSDIDVLVCYNDIQALVIACKKHKLFEKYDEISFNIDFSAGHHHVEFSTEYIFENIIYNVNVEFHYSFYPNNIHRANKAIGVLEQVLCNTSKLKIQDINFPILSPIDNIVFVSCHAIKHMVWDFLRGKGTKYISISNFYDVYKMLNEFYSKDGDLYQLVQRARDYGVLPEILLAHHMAYKLFAITSCENDGIKNYLKDIDPNTRWISLISFYIIKENFMHDLLLPINQIVKKIISYNARTNDILCNNDKCTYFESKSYQLKTIFEEDGSQFYIKFNDENEYNDTKKIKMKYLDVGSDNMYQIIDIPQITMDDKCKEISFFVKKDIMFKYVDKANYIYFDMLFVNEGGIVKTFCENSKIHKPLAYMVGEQ